MSTYYRALCAELVRCWDAFIMLKSHTCWDDPPSTDSVDDAVEKIRTALAQPEAEGPPRPPLATAVDRPDLVRHGVTWDGSPDKPLLTPASDGYWTPWHIAARLPQPIPVSERLPGPEDCDEDCMLWLYTPDIIDPEVGSWTWAYVDNDRDTDVTHWLPHWALPLPVNPASGTNS